LDLPFELDLVAFPKDMPDAVPAAVEKQTEKPDSFEEEDNSLFQK